MASVGQNKLKTNKVLGTQNPADMNTKGLCGEEIAKYTERLHMGYKEGRAELAPEVHQMINKKKCTRFNSTSSIVTHKGKVREKQQSLENLQLSKKNRFEIGFHVSILLLW